MSDYPEHDKLTEVNDASQAIGEFLDTSGYVLCRWRNAGNTGAPRYVWREGVTYSRAQAKPTDGRDPILWDYANGDATDNPVFEEWGEGFVPVPGSIERILAGYFDIDLDKIEAEKRAMLEALRR